MAWEAGGCGRNPDAHPKSSNGSNPPQLENSQSYGIDTRNPMTAAAGSADKEMAGVGVAQASKGGRSQPCIELFTRGTACVQQKRFQNTVALGMQFDPGERRDLP